MHSQPPEDKKWTVIWVTSWEYLSLGICDQVRLKLACSGTAASWSLETSSIATTDIILSRERITKMLIRLHGCAGWSVSLLFTYDKQVLPWCGSYEKHNVVYVTSIYVLPNAHVQLSSGARSPAFSLRVLLVPCNVWAYSKGSGETAQMCSLACAFAIGLCGKYPFLISQLNFTWTDRRWSLILL